MSNPGKLIVIDGLDGSGKTTQLGLVNEYLKGSKISFKEISFPDYKEDSSALVKMYLSGEFGDNVSDVNAYAASSFYAVDRYASYKRFWGKNYLGGKMIVAARYTTSNAIHQMAKLPTEKWDEYLLWLEDFEYLKLELPKPDVVIFLDMPIEVSQKLLSERYKGDHTKKDIHEKDIKYLHSCRKAALYSAKKLGWIVIDCAENGEPIKESLITKKLISAII